MTQYLCYLERGGQPCLVRDSDFLALNRNHINVAYHSTRSLSLTWSGKLLFSNASREAGIQFFTQQLDSDANRLLARCHATIIDVISENMTVRSFDNLFPSGTILIHSTVSQVFCFLGKDPAELESLAVGSTDCPAQLTSHLSSSLNRIVVKNGSPFANGILCHCFPPSSLSNKTPSKTTAPSGPTRMSPTSHVLSPIAQTDEGRIAIS